MNPMPKAAPTLPKPFAPILLGREIGHRRIRRAKNRAECSGQRTTDK